MVPFQGWGRVAAPAVLARGAVLARRLIRNHDVGVVVGMGGYPSLPAVVGARLAGVPILVHESGAMAGRANRLAARLTPHVATAFPETAGLLGRGARTLGMPLSGTLSGFDRSAARPAARAGFELPEGVALILVLGGSQGATRLNAAAVGLASRWRDRADVRLLIKTGVADAERVQGQLAGNDRATAVAHLDRMDLAYAAADLVICRAGGGTVAELVAAGLPSILVPYPHAIDNHQLHNARVLVDAGAAVVVRDEDASADRLAPITEQLLGDSDRRTRMAAAACGLARPHAAEDMAAWALELATAHAGGR